MFKELAKNIIKGYKPEIKEYKSVINSQDEDMPSIMAGADLLRRTYKDSYIHLCAIKNGKSGNCSEDCAFCSQALNSKANFATYPLLPKDKLQKGAIDIKNTPINRYSIVTSGKRLPKNEVKKIAKAICELNQGSLSYCTSLGILDDEDFKTLKNAGISRYHHNLETAKSHFDKICTTHGYEERINAIRVAKKQGLSVCSGGIFGIGETNDQILELALCLKELDVDAVPINFLTPIEGTPFENAHDLTPLKCLRIIALFRYVLPEKEIIICGGRRKNLGQLHSMIFYAGASGIMTGDYLTVEGSPLKNDMEMLKQLKLKTLPK